MVRVEELGRLSFLRDEALWSFLRMMVWFLLPLLVALAGLALLTNVITALLWVTIIVSIAFLYVRFNAKHDEHPEYDDHLSPEHYAHGFQTYQSLLEKEKDKPRN